MKRAFRIIMTMLLLIGWGLAASALHVVWTGSSVIIIPKNRLGVVDTYVDITKWTTEDVTRHPTVSKRLVQTGKSETLAEIFKVNGQDLIDQILEAANREPASKPAPTIIDKAKEVAHQATQVVQH